VGFSIVLDVPQLSDQDLWENITHPYLRRTGTFPQCFACPGIVVSKHPTEMCIPVAATFTDHDDGGCRL
jgi:hypothetical protein